MIMSKHLFRACNSRDTQGVDGESAVRAYSERWRELYEREPGEELDKSLMCDFSVKGIFGTKNIFFFDV